MPPILRRAALVGLVESGVDLEVAEGVLSPRELRGDNVQREGHRNRWRRAAGCVPPRGYPCTNLTSIGTRNNQPPGWPTFSQLTFDKLINKSVFPILSHFPVLQCVSRWAAGYAKAESFLEC